MPLGVELVLNRGPLNYLVLHRLFFNKQSFSKLRSYDDTESNRIYLPKTTVTGIWFAVARIMTSEVLRKISKKGYSSHSKTGKCKG